MNGEAIPLLGSQVNLSVSLDVLPKCPKCSEGIMLPMQDEARSGAIYVKAWICNACFHNIALKAGELYKMPVPGDKIQKY